MEATSRPAATAETIYRHWLHSGIVLLPSAAALATASLSDLIDRVFGTTPEHIELAAGHSVALRLTGITRAGVQRTLEVTAPADS